MAKKKRKSAVQGFRPTTARRIKKNAGGQHTSIISEFSPRQSVGARIRYGALLEDGALGSLWVQPTDKFGNVLDEDPFEGVGWGRTGLINGLPAGAICQWVFSAGEWDFHQADECASICLATGSITGNGTLTLTANAAMSNRDIVGTNCNSVSLGALPAGLSYAPNTPAESGGVISGTPTETGVTAVQIVYVSDKAGAPSETCSKTKVLVITVEAAS